MHYFDMYSKHSEEEKIRGLNIENHPSKNSCSGDLFVWCWILFGVIAWTVYEIEENFWRIFNVYLWKQLTFSRFQF